MLCCLGKTTFKLGLERIECGKRAENRGFPGKHTLNFNVAYFTKTFTLKILVTLHNSWNHGWEKMSFIFLWNHLFALTQRMFANRSAHPNEYSYCLRLNVSHLEVSWPVMKKISTAFHKPWNCLIETGGNSVIILVKSHIFPTLKI